MTEHKPGAKPIDPDTTSPAQPADDVKKRDVPRHLLGPDRPEKLEDALPGDEE
jgi:hypothetical protein